MPLFHFRQGQAQFFPILVARRGLQDRQQRTTLLRRQGSQVHRAAVPGQFHAGDHLDPQADLLVIALDGRGDGPESGGGVRSARQNGLAVAAPGHGMDRAKVRQRGADRLARMPCQTRTLPSAAPVRKKLPPG